ncbi:class I SAM-dependent methyltransferase [Lacticaseibacillus daqingensis]|uniref:class I SAM-dependent methyltransferase n=1 Tax=Lacticaseibacillus daqingensis TaxID=2486014 RepID=UPI000F773E4E|nr:class I SAM-dependent methyltransferase [Lacticaseibacillus daqingensis]
MLDDPHTWDDFAPTYAAVQRESRLPIEQDVTAALAARWPLTGWTVADVAGGTGRYARPLAAHAQQVTLIDWSAGMLKEAQHALSDLPNVHYRQADWRTLPAAPLADLVFVSQLPTLTAAQLPRLTGLARHAVALNVQSAACNSLLVAMAAALGLPVPVTPQADPQHVATLQAALPVAAETRTFSYQLTDQYAVSDLLAAFARPFSLREARALAQAVSNQPDANLLLPVTLTYTFQLWTWATDK